MLSTVMIAVGIATCSLCAQIGVVPESALAVACVLACVARTVYERRNKVIIRVRDHMAHDSMRCKNTRGQIAERMKGTHPCRYMTGTRYQSRDTEGQGNRGELGRKCFGTEVPMTRTQSDTHHGLPWSTVVDHGRPRSTMVDHGRS